MEGLGLSAEVVGLAEDPTVAGTLLVGLGPNGTAATRLRLRGVVGRRGRRFRRARVGRWRSIR